jgi:two-component system, LuxR family, sensor kinase FixL
LADRVPGRQNQRSRPEAKAARRGPGEGGTTRLYPQLPPIEGPVAEQRRGKKFRGRALPDAAFVFMLSGIGPEPQASFPRRRHRAAARPRPYPPADHRRREDLWRAGEDGYRFWFELNPSPMWIFDEDTLRFLAVNEAAGKLYGWTREQFLRLTILNIRPVTGAPGLMRQLARHRAPGATFTTAWRHQKRDGTLFNTEVTLRRLHFRGREAWLGTVQDITERKRAEAQLKRLNATLKGRAARRARELATAFGRLQAVMDTALVGIITLDAEGNILSLNPAARRIFGYGPREPVGGRVTHLLAPVGRAQPGSLPELLLEAAKGDRGEISVRTRDARVIMLELSVTGYTDGGRRHYTAVVRDVTRRKWLERALLEISERERLRIGHDLHDGLGQQLHGLSYLAALLEQGLKEDASPRAAEAGQLNNYLRESLEMIRGLARGLEPVEAVPQGLMAAMREMAGRVSGLHRVDCQFVCEPELLVYRQMAAGHLYRIAQEAVNNATKHGKPTRIRIRIAAARGSLTLSVRDNGMGIRRRAGRRRGMGLHIMRHRADALGGSLVVRKLPRGGTEVACTVPRESLLPQDERLA